MAGCSGWCRRTCVCCLSEDEKRTIAVDKEIQRILKQQKMKERREIKILLLGQCARLLSLFHAGEIQTRQEELLLTRNKQEKTAQPVWWPAGRRASYVRHVSPFEYEKNGPDGDWHRPNVAQLKTLISGLTGRKRSPQLMFSAENVTKKGHFHAASPWWYQI